MEYPIKMDDLGDTIIFGNTHIGFALSWFRWFRWCFEVMICLASFDYE